MVYLSLIHIYLLLKDEDNESIYCRTLLFATDNELWIGTESGAYIYNLRTGKYTHLRSSDVYKRQRIDSVEHTVYWDGEIEEIAGRKFKR